MLTLEELKTIYDHAYFRRKENELSLLITLLMSTPLKMCDLLGWFNHNRNRRLCFLRNTKILEEYERVVILFPKKHQTYLLQWKKTAKNWIGKKSVTFELLRKSCKIARKKGQWPSY